MMHIFLCKNLPILRIDQELDDILEIDENKYYESNQSMYHHKFHYYMQYYMSYVEK